MRITKVDDPVESANGDWSYVVTYANGETTTHEFSNRQSAKHSATTKRKKIKGTVVDTDFREPDGTLGWWSRSLQYLAHKVMLDGDSDDRNNLKAIAQAALAAKQLADLTEQEDRLRELEELTAQIDGVERYAAGA